MIGVVLWSDACDRKAVIWCEDQGDLAFFSSSSDVLDKEGFFDAGDLVQFDMEVRASMRRVLNPRLVIEQGGCALTEALRQTVDESPAPQQRGKVIPIRPRAAAKSTLRPERRVREA